LEYSVFVNVHLQNVFNSLLSAELEL